jgi:O-antigen/teichoic acid export membrane protein
LVGSIGFAAAPFVAAAFSLGPDWPSFAVIGLIVFVRSLENLAPRVAERDYRYGPQAKVATVANGLSLAALFAALWLKQGHNAITLSLLALAFGFVLASRVFSNTPYRLRFRSPFFLRAFKFGYPLMFNGIGLAVSAQGDRFLVGAMLDLPALGVYSVLTLVTTASISIVSRLINTVMVATLVNAAREARKFDARLRLASRLAPLIGAFLGVGFLTLMNIVVPLVFGHKFVASNWMVILLAFGAFVRIARVDPGSALLLTQGRTKRLALVNFAVVSGIAFSACCLFFFRTMESAALGRLVGEIAGLAAMHRLAFVGSAAAADSLIAFAACAAIVSFSSAITYFMTPGSNLVPNLTLLGACTGGMILWAWRFAPPLARIGFPQLRGINPTKNA